MGNGKSQREIGSKLDPNISVIIPHLNQPDHLRGCLRSLHEQSYGAGAVEIIVVDNGSSPAPTDVCAGFLGVHLEIETEPGPGPARNTGVAASKGDVLAFIDADCIADGNWLAAVAAAFADPATSVIGGDVRIAAKNPARLTTIEAYESVFAYRQREYIEKKGFSGTGNLAMRRAIYKAVGPFAGIDIAEDRDWGRRATERGYTIRYVPDMVVYHPARESFAELYAKWDRHIGHDFVEQAHGFSGRAVWILKAAAVAVSPLLELGPIGRSSRIVTRRDQALAMAAVTRLRLYRASQMFVVLFGATGARAGRRWNRG